MIFSILFLNGSKRGLLDFRRRILDCLAPDGVERIAVLDVNNLQLRDFSIRIIPLMSNQLLSGVCQALQIVSLFYPDRT